MNSTCELKFAGQQLTLDASGALWWAKQRMLVVSDMHLEKSTFLGQHGSMLAPYDTHDTLLRLEQLISQYQPEELVLLGDSFHDRQAWQRLDADLRTRILKLHERVARISWIEGNHDVGLEQHFLPGFIDAREVEGIRLSHQDIRAGMPHIVGHYHPKTRVAIARQRVRSACFISNHNLLLMPSFGSYTGGLDISHEAIHSLFDTPTRVHFLYRQKIWLLPQHASCIVG